MKNTKAVVVTAALSRSALDATAGRSLAFLRTIGLSPTVRGEMVKAGYTAADHTEGWTLLINASGYGALDTGAEVNPAMAANAEIEAWIVPGFQRARAVLHRKHPEAEAYVFQDLKASRGPEALVQMNLFLDRLDALESSPARKSTRKEDHAALESLAERGITPDVRKHLRSLLTLIQKQPLGATPAPVQSDKTKALTALHSWLMDWSDTARAVITNRAQLIQLGIAKRRAKGATAPIADPIAPIAAPPVVTAPVVTVPELPPVVMPALPAASATPTPPAVAAAPSEGAAPTTEVLSTSLNGSTRSPMVKTPTL